MLSMVVLPISIRSLFPAGLFFFDTGVSWIVHALVNFNVHFLNENAISWNSISLLNINQVADNKFSDGDGMTGSMSSSINNYGLVINFILKLQELKLLDVITDGRHQGSKD